MSWRNSVELPADLADPFHPNIRTVPMPLTARDALGDYFDDILSPTKWDCPACDHSPHPTEERLAELAAMPYQKYLWSPEWRRTRNAKLLEVGHRCRRCRRTSDHLHVHHLTYDHLGHEWLDELVAVCEPCHRAVHDDRAKGWRRRPR